MATIQPAHQSVITHLYVALFDRAPDALGLSFWAQAYADGASLATITPSFMQTAEGRATCPVSQTSSQFVASFYQTVFGREADVGGLAFWTSALDASGDAGSDAARAALIGQLVGVVSQPLDIRPEGLSDAAYAQTVADRALFANKAEVGDYVVSLNINDVVLARQTLALVTADPASVPIAKAFAASGGVTPLPPGPPAPSWFITNADALPEIVSKLADYPGTDATVDATGMDTAKLDAVADGIAKIASRGIGGVLGLTAADYAGATITTLATKLALDATLAVTGTVTADTITLRSFPRSTTINSGEGDDVFSAVVDGDTPANTTINAHHKLNGGDGIDTLTLSVTGGVAAALKGATLTDIERISVHVSEAGSARFSAPTSVTEVIASGAGSLTIDALRNGATLVLDGTEDTGRHSAHYAAGTTARLSLLNEAASDVITIDGASVTTLNVTQRGLANEVGSLVLGSNISTMTFSGEGGTVIGGLSGGAGGLSLTVASMDVFALSGVTATGVNVDASASTGMLALTFDLPAGTVKGGSNADILMVFDTATLTGNGGADVFVMREGVGQEAAISLASLNAKLVTITDFSAGDRLAVEATVNLAVDPEDTPVNGTLQKVTGSGANLLAATQDAAAQLRTMAADMPYVGFVYNAASYLLVDSNLDGLGAGDMLIRLTGSPDLTRITYENDLLTMT